MPEYLCALCIRTFMVPLGDSAPANDTLMIVLVTSVTAAVVTVLLILLIVIICMKKHRSKVSD